MNVPGLAWFRDEDGWTMPDGRRGELVGLVVCIPAFCFVVALETGLLNPLANPIPAVGGLCCGFCYATDWRERLLALVPERARSFAISSLFSGGIVLTILEIVHLAAPTVAFVLAASLTTLAVYGARLLSPVHDGMRPPRRGVEPPRALDSEPTDRRA